VNKTTGRSEFYNVEYDMHPIPDEVVWENVIVKESMWAYPRDHSAKQQMRRCYADLTSDRAGEVIARSQAHVEYLREKFAEDKQYALMVSEICETLGVNPENSAEEDVLEFD
jgi:hypothetical protein